MRYRIVLRIETKATWFRRGCVGSTRDIRLLPLIMDGMRVLLLISLLLLGACSRPPTLPTAWARADGQPVVSGLLDIATLDCKDEVQSPDAGAGGNASLSGRVMVDHFVGCMREHGYVQIKS